MVVVKTDRVVLASNHIGHGDRGRAGGPGHDLSEVGQDRLAAGFRSRQRVIPRHVPHSVVSEQFAQRRHVARAESRARSATVRSFTTLSADGEGPPQHTNDLHAPAPYYDQQREIRTDRLGKGIRHVLKKEENELATRIGPETPMGNLMRQYWMPALMSSELPGNDSDPVRLMLLGEQLVAFRDTHGRVGILQHACPHRRAPLFLGRVEEDGLRCVYHGWKFDVTGACVDMPNEPPDSDFKHKIERAGYPCVEHGGMIWTYLGPRSVPPPLPGLEQFDLAPEYVYIEPELQEANWLQIIEGDLDTVHAAFLHGGHLTLDDAVPGTFAEHSVRQRSLRYKLVDTDFGYTCGAYRPAGDPDHTYWRIGHFLFPFYTLVPTGVLGIQKNLLITVPMDDTHTMRYSVVVSDHHDGAIIPGRILRDDTTPYLPNTTDWFGRWRRARNKQNDYLIDRQEQRRGDTYTGLPGVATEDRAMTELMGPILDRSAERLGSTDMAVIRLRRRLIAAAKGLADDSAVPPGVDDPHAYQQRSGGVVLHKDDDWLEATVDLRRTDIEHPELNPAMAGGT
jgi:phthalate 4,5-dioxygenase oxygenase subunit